MGHGMNHFIAIKGNVSSYIPLPISLQTSICLENLICNMLPKMPLLKVYPWKCQSD